MPKLWNETIETHRRAVRETTLDVTAALVAEHGPASVTMSQIAGAAGIGRATLYKYFPDVGSVLAGWYEREVSAQLVRLAELRDREDEPARRLTAVLHGYALLVREQAPGLALGALPADDERVARTRRLLLDLFRDLLARAADSGAVRDDTAPEELAAYCLHALGAAAELPTTAGPGGPAGAAPVPAALDRLVTVTLAGLSPGGGAAADS